MPFDVVGAKKAGYSDQEIADHLASTNKFDAAGARASGYSDAEIIDHLMKAPAAAPANESPYEMRARKLQAAHGGAVDSQAGDVAKQGVKTGAGLVENALAILTGGAESAAKGLGGMGALVAKHPILKAIGIKAPDAADVVERISTPTYTPHTAGGKEVEEKLQIPMQGLEDVKRTLGEKTLEATDSPLAATAAHMIPDVLMAVAGGPKGGKPTLAGTVEHTAGETGLHTVIAKDAAGRMGQTVGEMTAQESGPYLKAERADVTPSQQGIGHGTAMYEKLIEEAGKRGLKFSSDVSVSPDAAGVYAKLRELGYDVKQNPSEVNPTTGNLISKDPRVPVFEVTGKKVTAAEIPTEKMGTLGKFFNSFTEEGRKKIATAHQRDIIGSPQTQADIINKLENPPAAPEGYAPTVGELVSQTPGGGGLLAEENLIRRTPGETNAAFARRQLANKKAVAAAQQQLTETTGPMREAAIERANELGAADVRAEPGPGQAISALLAKGVKTGEVTRGIKNLLREPGTRASDVARRTLTELQDKLNSLRDEHGLINAEDLYVVRKEIGNNIKTHAKNTSTWDKKMTSALERRIQKTMDDAIEAGGGKGWKEYLQTYSEGAKVLGEVKGREKLKRTPLERANMTGEKLGGSPQLPNAFSREVLITNAILRAVTPDMSHEYAAILARRYLSPAEQARILRGEPMEPGTRAKLWLGAKELGKTKGAVSAADADRKARAAALRQE